MGMRTRAAVRLRAHAVVAVAVVAGLLPVQSGAAAARAAAADTATDPAIVEMEVDTTATAAAADSAAPDTTVVNAAMNAVATAAPGAPAAPSSGVRLRLPVPPPATVRTPFRPPAHPYGPGHRGVDLAADVGAPVSAAADGTVVFAGMVAGLPVVSIDHAHGLRTTYEPVTASVVAGQSVAAGDRIGTLRPGHPPCAPDTCLHWGARLSAPGSPDPYYLDPMTLLAGRRVVLKPWGG